MSRSVCFTSAHQLAGRLGGPCAPCARASSSSSSSSTQRHTSPWRSAASPSSTSPNSTMAAAVCGPTRVAQHPRVAAAGVEAEVEEAGVELARRAGEAHVAAQRQVHAGADGGAVDGGEGRQRRAADPEEALVDRRAGSSAAPAGAEVAEVGAGAERGRRAGDDDRADAVVGLERVEGGDDLVDHRRGERVAALGVVEGRRRRRRRRPRARDQAHCGSSSLGRRRASGGRSSRRRARSGTRAGCSPTVLRRRSASANDLDRARPTCTVVEPGPLEPAVVDAAAVAQQVEQLGRQVDSPSRRERRGRELGAERRERRQCACRRSTPPRSTAAARRRRRCRCRAAGCRARRGSTG